MAYHSRSSQKTRRRRKLPNIQQVDITSATSATIFWYNYQSALTYIRNHENVISKCVQLLQIYPNLIQDSSMDHFWDFIESLVHVQSSGKTDASGTEGNRNKKDTNSSVYPEKENSAKGSDIPHISVTETSNTLGPPTFTISAHLARTPRVHLISRSNGGDQIDDDRLLHSGVIDMLQEDFYLRVTNTKQQTSLDMSKESGRQYVVAESDVCVYLFNNATLEDAACLHDLCIAMAQKIPVVYVRYHKKDLPKTLPETINSNTKGCVTLKDYIDKFMPEPHSGPARTSSGKSTGLKKKLAPLIVGKRSKSASELNVSQIWNLGGKHQRSSASLEIDLLFTLVNNFKNACVFDESDFNNCASRLRQAIHEILGISDSRQELQHGNKSNGSIRALDDYALNSGSKTTNNNQSNIISNKLFTDFKASIKTNRTFLSVPDPEDMISTKEWGSSGHVSASPQGQPNRDCYSAGGREDSICFDIDSHNVSSPTLEQKATTYLIFDQNNVLDGPRKLEFPSEAENAIFDSGDDSSDCQAAPDSPINFHDIDLGREINNRGTPESVSSVN